MSKEKDFHEKHVSIHNGKIPSEKSFGIFLSGLLGSVFFIKNQWNFIFLMASILCLVLVFLKPHLFFWPNFIVYRAGTIFRKVWTFAIMLVVFLGLVTPLAVIRKIVTWFSPNTEKFHTKSYWIQSQPSSSSFKEQF